MLPLFFSPHPCFRASTSTYPRMNFCVFADEHLLCRFFMFPAPCSGVQLGKIFSCKPSFLTFGNKKKK